MKDVVFLSLKPGVPAADYWDQFLLFEIFYDQNIYRDASILNSLEEAIVIIPGAYQWDIVESINQVLAPLKKCAVIVTSDEENRFPLEKLRHPCMDLYATYPHETEAEVTWLPIGPTPHSTMCGCGDKTIDILFAGQVTNESRQKMFDALIASEKPELTIELYPSSGFAQGLPAEDYHKKMAAAKVVLCPKGNVSEDSFRLYEALEKGAIPIPQNPDFWQKLFISTPFPIVSNNEQWIGYAEDAVKQYPALNNRCQAWWTKKKREIRECFIPEKNNVTIFVPVSPIPSHPDSFILEETLRSIRSRYKKELIIIGFDGVRPEQEHLRSAYEHHIQTMLAGFQNEKNILPLIFDEHRHQIGMMKHILAFVKTPLLFFVEQDTPLEGYIPTEEIENFILSGQSDLVRFSHESEILPDYKHLMIGEPENNFIKTIQWSQRPHIASVAYYRRILEDCFSYAAKCMIEDKMHSVVQRAFYESGIMGWYQHKLHIYHPEGNIRRSYHTDGRQGAEKFDSTQIF